MFTRASVVMLVGLLLLPSASALAQSSAGAASLQIPPSARANGMGGAHVAVVNDATAMWWNPAALAFMPDRQATLMHSQLVPSLADDVYYEYFGYTSNIEGLGSIGASIVYLTYGKNVATDFSGNVIGEFTSFEIAPSFGLGTKITENISIGANVKFVWVDLAPAAVTRDGEDGRGTTFAVDGAVLWKIPRYRVNAGLNFQNIGPNLAFIDEDQSDPLPRNLKFGLAWWAIANEQQSLILTGDLNKPFVAVDDGPILNVGTEYNFGRYLTGRLGYVYEGWFQAIEPISGPSFGFGLRYKSFSFDYASWPQAPDLDRVSRFSFNVRF
ncbi:MAG: PorV/PorQ family protein [Candidatus Eiseniibacteriota bacterium]|jgi:hypothetical protein